MDDDVTFGHLTTELQNEASHARRPQGAEALSPSARHLLAARIALVCGVTFAEAYQQIDNACTRMASDESI